jgi:hypothetical protein
MTFKKGDKVRIEDGRAGEILFIDNHGLEAQVALERISVKIRTDTLRLFASEDLPAPTLHQGKVVARKRPARTRPRE